VYAVHADYVSTVEWAKNAELRILSPYNAEYENDADNGLVLRLSYGNSGITILGKAGALAERMMVKALPNRLLHTDVIFLTETDGSQAPYDKFFKVSKADRYVMKSFPSNSGAVSALQSFIDKQGLVRIEIGRGLHLVLDGVDIQVVE